MAEVVQIDPAIARLLSPLERADPHRQLLKNAHGVIKACESNAVVLLRANEQFAQLHHDDFYQRLRIGERDWTDADALDALLHLQGNWKVPGFTLRQVSHAAQALAYERRRDALKDFVVGLPEHDGKPRIEFAFRDAWGAPDNPVIRAASANLFVAMIARALRPGAQVDTLWTFEGPQGSFKSRALRALGGDFHAEITAPIGTADFMRELLGLWLAELAELDSLRGREASTVKRLLSTPFDRFVQKYALYAATYPRRAIAVATTNEARYWQDATGARRLIPIPCDRIDVELIERERLQWFAEARDDFTRGAAWWEFPATIADDQDDRQQVDPWEDVLRRAMHEGRARTADDPPGDGRVPWPAGWVASAEIMRTWLRLEPHQQQQVSATRLGRVMRRLGFVPAKDSAGNQRGWKSDTCDASAAEVSGEVSGDVPF